MLIAGVVELPGEVVFAILAALLLAAVAYAVVGGTITSAVSGRRGTFWFGFVTCPMVALLTADSLGGGSAVVAGWLSAGMVGLCVRELGPAATDGN